MVNTTSSADVQVPLVVVQRSVALVPAGIPVTLEVRRPGVVIVAVPLTRVHVPVPVVTALPASVNVPLLHCAWSGPAAAVVGNASFVSTTSSVDEQVPLVTVHRSVALVPTGTPDTPDVDELGLAMIAVPLNTLQDPVPVVGLFAASVNVPVLHFSWAMPASAVVAWASLVRTTSSHDEGHTPLVIVQRRVALVPAGTPVTPELAEVEFVIVAVPLTTLHAPVPVVGTFPASVNALLLHCVWSGPAFAVVGTADTVAAPVDTVCVVAFVELALMLPLTPLVASDFNLT